MPRRAKKTTSSKLKRTERRPARPFRKIVRKLKIRVAQKGSRLKNAALSAVSEPERETSSAPVWEDRRLPAGYGDDRLVLLVRDPWWLYAYWEVTRARQEEAERQLADRHRKTVLRVYDVTGLSLPKFRSYFDIELNFHADNWYVDVGLPDREWVAEIGLRGASGRFVAMARSNRVRTPSFGISDVLDEEWMLPEDIYYRLIGRSIGAGSSGSSMDIRSLLEKYLRNVVSSERPPETARHASTKGVAGA